MTQLPLTLPAYTPSRWELTLPGYPAIDSNFRSASFPELLGSLPSDSRWKLYFDNITSQEVLAILLLWRATGMGMWPLTALPETLAGGVNDEDFKKRLTGTTWSIEREPTKQLVKNNRFNVVIDLIHELTFSSIYGPRRKVFSANTSPLPLNISNTILITGIPTAISKARPVTRSITGPVANLDISHQLTIAGLPV